jgi:hypothetical protein
MNRAGSSSGLAFLAKALALFDELLELAALFGLLAFTLHEALLRLGLQTGFALGASLVCGCFGGSRSRGLVRFAAENF